jgi:hypothetical protein
VIDESEVKAGGPYFFLKQYSGDHEQKTGWLAPILSWRSTWAVTTEPSRSDFVFFITF